MTCRAWNGSYLSISISTFHMHRPSFEYVPREDIPAFVSQHTTDDNPPISPPPLHPLSSPDDILTSSMIPSPPPQQPPAPRPQRPPRIYLKSKDVQRGLLASEYAAHGVTKPLSYYTEKTRLTNKTVKRLIKKIQAGEDITKEGKRGRKPKYTPELLKTIASKLCVENNTLRDAKKAIARENIQAIEAGTPTLPEVSLTTMHRYVKNDELMSEVDVGPLSFTRVSIRGPAANSDENKELRVLRRRELDALIKAGYMPIFVDESHWSVGNVRNHGWGRRGEKHFRTRNLASFSLSCICAISMAGDRHCKLFNSTINGEMFTAYMRELIALCRSDERTLFLSWTTPTFTKTRSTNSRTQTGAKSSSMHVTRPNATPLKWCLAFGRGIKYQTSPASHQKC